MCISKTFQNGVLVGWGESLSNKIQQIISFYLTDDRAGSLSSFCRGFVFWWHLPRNFLPLWRGWGWAQRPRLACRFRLLNTEIITQINRCAAWRRRSCREEETLQREETAEPKPKQRPGGKRNRVERSFGAESCPDLVWLNSWAKWRKRMEPERSLAPGVFRPPVHPAPMQRTGQQV